VIALDAIQQNERRQSKFTTLSIHHSKTDIRYLKVDCWPTSSGPSSVL